jgi:hypothetical protein
MKTVKLLILIVMIFLPVMSGAAPSGISAKGPEEARIAGLRILLNAYAALAEEHLEGTLRVLKILAATDEAKSADWNSIKGLLTEFSASGINAAAVWYARPDGRYYTAEQGGTDRYLRDRAYFPRLMAGNAVVGELVISKSTGKRAVVVAAPIRKDGKVIGALGVSLSAEAVSRMLQESMALPGNMIFYALDARGQCALHQASSRLFAFPSDIGSKTLKEAAREMLSRQEGMVRYEFHGEKNVVFKRSRLTGWVFAIGVVAGAPAEDAGDDLATILGELEKEIGLGLNRIDTALAKAAKGLAVKGMRSAEARIILRDLCRSTSSAVDCAIVDGSGRMIVVEPEEYRRFEGADIRKQEQIIRLHKAGKPVMSRVIRTVEGFDAVDIEYPVFTARGELAGSVSILIRPESLISEVATSLVQGLPIDVWAMQGDGRILYDPDKEEIGRILFTDPIYKPFPQLRSLGKMISNSRTGSGSYEFFGKGLKKQVRKDAFWTSVGLYSTEWRVVATHTRAGDGPYAKRDLAELGVKSSEESLRELAGREELKEAMARNDKDRMQGLFRDYHARQYGIYAIQWVDASGTNRYGYPEENSPMSYDFHAMNTPSSPHILQALAAKTESSFEAPLAEGKVGNFFMVPVQKGDAYLGMIYFIRVVP